MKNVVPLPDLSHLSATVSLAFILNRVFRQAGPRERIAYVLVTQFIRLVDKTVHEYELARSFLAEYASTPSNVVSPLLYAVGHMENCLNAMNRALNFAERIKRHRPAPALDRLTSTRLTKALDQIKLVRGSIEHVETDLISGELPEGEAVALTLHEGQIELAGHKVRVADLVSWITALHELAVEWADYHDPEEGGSGGSLGAS